MDETKADNEVGSKRSLRKQSNVRYPSTIFFLLFINIFPATVLPTLVVPQARASSPPVNVTIGDFFFNPLHLNVTTGTTVIWTYVQGSTRHTVTSVNQSQSGTYLFSSGNIFPGNSFSYTFYNPGFYKYYCSWHPTIASMNGWVNATGPVITPPPTPHDYTAVMIWGSVAVLVAAGVSVYFVKRRRAKLPGKTGE